MYICICNAIKESEVLDAARSGTASTASQYLRQRGIAPKCGKCVAEVHRALRDGSGGTVGIAAR